MKKIACIIVFLILILPFTASYGAEEQKAISPYFFVQSEDPSLDPFPLIETKARVDIAGVIAAIELTQVYKNAGTRTIEAVYVFPLGTKSAIHAMRMKIGDRIIEATIEERAAAKQIYDRAKEAGDREKYMTLQFDQATDGLTFKQYQSFKKMCHNDEWERYEPKILEHMKGAHLPERLKIHMHRKEYAEAMALLAKSHYPVIDWDCNDEIRIAKKLEKHYPEEILKYYLSGLGNLTVNATRKEYARKANVMAKVRRVLVEVIGDESRWKKFAAKVKQDNIRRPAFQEEFSKVAHINSQ